MTIDLLSYLPFMEGGEEKAAQGTYSRMMEIWNKMLKLPTLSAVMEKQEEGLSAPQHFGSVLGTPSHGGRTTSFPPPRLARDIPPSTVGALAHT